MFIYFFFIKYILFSRKQKTDADHSVGYDFTRFKDQTLLDESTGDILNTLYQPKTNETKQIYEVLLNFIQETIGDQVCFFFK
jgi:hypothetical protein